MATSEPSAYQVGEPFGVEVSRSGWLLFTTIAFFWSGIWNAFQGMVALIKAAYFIGHPVYGDVWVWGLLWMVFGLVEVGIGGAILAGSAWARWTGIVLTALHALLTMAALATYPWWAAIMLVVDFVILYALTARWQQPASA